jgi:arylsulfatase A-like enzyme/Flp pilus assembly protein TadD
MRWFRLCLWVAIAAAWVTPAFCTEREGLPNVLVITIDTLRADHLGCYGYKDAHTPNLDGLAGEGVRFERAYTPVPITLPSHTVIFTGTYPTASGIHDFSANRLGPQSNTMASLLKDKGYTTGAVVASAVLDSRFGLNRGFDFYYDHFDFNRLEEANLDEMERPANAVADVAIDWLGQNAGKRFFFWMHLYDPHAPYKPPAPYDAQFRESPYDGEIAFADAQVGRVLQFLKSKRLYDKTLIILSGDHGEGLGEHGEKTHGFFIYNSTLHVPLIVRVPGAKPHAVSEPVTTADILPSLLEEISLPIPAQVQGTSFAAALEGKDSTHANARGLYAETFLPRLHFNWSELRGIQFERYTFIEAPKPELYDLEKDPKELQNLFDQKKAVATELRSKLSALIRADTPSTELAEKMPLDPALLERLKALGYAGFSGGGDPSAKASTLPDPKDRIQVYELISDGMADGQHGRYEDSIAKLTEALKTEPNSVAVNYLLGLDYYRLGDFPKSAEHLKRVMQFSPDYSLAVFHLGLALGRMGQTDDAIAAFQRALELDSTNFPAAYDLGQMYLQKKMMEPALAAFRQSVTVNPDYLQGRVALGELLLYQGQVDEALTQLRAAVQIAPNNPQVHASLAKALQAKGLPDEAQRELEKAQAAMPR